MTSRTEILSIVVADERDVFLVRQRGRDVAAAAGFENQDQVRVATALSELGRELVTVTGPATITLALVDLSPETMLIEADWSGVLGGTRGDADLAAVEGIAAAARLSDRCTVRWRSDGGSATFTKSLPRSGQALADRIPDITRALARSAPPNPLGSLREHNRDLVETLAALQRRQEELEQVNAELEETNRGVLALHAELSDELEQTNRGVVALYAELDEASTRLREASESKTRFWANVSHELRTPLNSVLGLARLLLDPAADPLTSEQVYQVGLIKDSADVLLALVNELLDVARAESGQIQPECVPVDLATVMGELSAAMRPVATNPDVTFDVLTPLERTALWTDPVLLGRVLRNLVSNAVKFTDRGGVRCEAAVNPDAGTVVISVHDTGVGIPVEHQHRVFEEFYQVPGEAQVGKRGSGLGLPYARRVATILGGGLELTSRPGEGTTVTISLPLDARVPGPAPGSVLLVDDDPAFREVLRGLLTSHVETVAEAVDGSSALDALRADVPELVLLDLQIPPPTGTEVLAQLRADPRLRGVPVVVLTSATLGDAERATLDATAEVLGKSELALDTLLAAVERARAKARVTS